MANDHHPHKKLARSTQARYAKTAGRLLARFEEENNCKIGDDVQFLQEWLINELDGNYSVRTIGVYRSALNYALRNAGIEIDLSNIGGASGNFGISGRRAKRLPDKVIDEMLKTAFHRKFGLHAQLGVTMMFCSRHFGLRPIEWLGAELDDQRLIVRNAKHSNGRSFGDFRTLHISEAMPERVMDAVRWLLNTIQSTGHHLADLDDREGIIDMKIGKAVRRVFDRAFPCDKPRSEPRFTLYSGRHQFAADAKASGLSKIEIAALMGHASPNTAGEHYGRRTSGCRDGIHVSPDEADILAVERIAFAKRITQAPSFV